MADELLLNFLSNIGVPAAVCFIMLFRVNPAIKDLTNAINKLSADIDRRLDTTEGEVKDLKHEVQKLEAEVHEMKLYLRKDG